MVKTGHDFPLATTLIATGSLDGMSFVDNHNGTATLSGTPAAGDGWDLRLHNHSNQWGRTERHTVVHAHRCPGIPVITSMATASFIVGSPGSFNVTSIGFDAPTLSDDGFSLPSGLSFTANENGAATLAGTPDSNAAGVYSFTFRAHNGVGSDALQNFTLDVYSTPAMVTSPTISRLGSLTATLGGTVTDIGSGPLLKRGVVYSLTATNANPSIGGPGVTEVDDASASAGTFAEVINGLKPGASYTFAAFATNGLTSYTTAVPFTTTSTLSSGIQWIERRTGRPVDTVHVVRFGSDIGNAILHFCFPHQVGRRHGRRRDCAERYDHVSHVCQSRNLFVAGVSDGWQGQCSSSWVNDDNDP